MDNFATTFRRGVSAILTIALLLGVIPKWEVTEASSPAVDKPEISQDQLVDHDLIVLVVDKNLQDDATSYPVLDQKYSSELRETTIFDRVLRYADDIKENNELTNVQILYFDKSVDDVRSLADALENIYKNGQAEGDNTLTGVVLVGDIPLPVVNKNGNRFVSLFPYTDFENKAYTFDSASYSYKLNPAVTFPKPEIWHGVISADTTNGNGADKLSEFFDKNHLYQSGVSEYADFDQKIFYADFVDEEKSINSEIYKQYAKYISSLEDLAYNRYNKFWASELTGEIMSNIAEDNELIETAQSSMGMVPDIYTKQIIDNYLSPYYKVVSSYISSVNGFVEGTGRFEADNSAALISIKDAYTQQYLKNTNDALEKAVDGVIEKIEAPLPLLKSAELSGYFTEPDSEKNPFEITVDAHAEAGVSVGFGTAEVSFDRTASSILLRFLYENEVTGDFYLNGVSADVLESAKQCSVFLGSTKNEYYDSDLNFNPKAVDGEYSILTRALRSDNMITAMPKHTAGVNSRTLVEDEALALTDGKIRSGAVIEDNPEYGISAFVDNPEVGSFAATADGAYKNGFSKKLQKGDVIYKINDKKIQSGYTVDDAMEEAYSKVLKIIKAVNDEDLDTIYALPYEIVTYNGQRFDAANAKNATANLRVEFFRNGEAQVAYLSFSVDKDGNTSSKKADGNPRMAIRLAGTPDGVDLGPTDGAIFTLYNTAAGGFNADGYDNSAGCNYNSTREYSDRCFYPLATMPVLDPAGSTMPLKTLLNGGSYKLQFPERIKNEEDVAETMPIFQIGDFENIDEFYLNSCYNGVPGIFAGVKNSSPYAFPLDPASSFAGSDGSKDYDVRFDLYGKMLDKIGDFITSYGTKTEKSPYKSSVWMDLDAVDAEDVVLNFEANMPTVTLKDFSDRYGMFDGKDNDGDGIADYEWRDLEVDEDGNTDGIVDTKWYDFDEADPKYGLDSKNIAKIERLMTSHDTKYTIPAALPDSPFDQDVTLVVQTNPYEDKSVSSMIRHNEPTLHTITEQLKAGNTLSLPIDDPRYVAFQSEPPAEPAGWEGPEGPDGHYYAGDLVRIDYPNLFQLNNYPEIQVKLDQMAWDLTKVSGSYKILSPAERPSTRNLDCSVPAENFALCKAVHDKILDKYLSPVVSATADQPISSANLERASGAKIADALAWKDMSLDDNHEYLLKRYLSDKLHAYAGDQTWYPGDETEGVGKGYEAAYLVLDGSDGIANLNFNKEIPEEDDPAFLNANGVYVYDGTNGAADAGAAGGENDGGSAASAADQDYVFVDWDEFGGEIERFLDSFTELPEFSNMCKMSDDEEDPTNNDGTSEVQQIGDPASLEINPVSGVLVANGVSETTVNFVVRDKNGNQVSDYFGQLAVFVDGNATTLTSEDGNKVLPGTEIDVVEGKASVRIKALEDPGDIKISAAILDYDLGESLSNQGAAALAGADLIGAMTEMQAVSDAELELTWNQAALPAGGDTIAKLDVKLLSNGKVLSPYNGPIEFSVLDNSLASFVAQPPSQMAEGLLHEANVRMRSGKKSGMAEVLVKVPGFTSKIAKLQIDSALVSALKLKVEKATLDSGNDVGTQVIAHAVDRYGNTVKNSEPFVVHFDATQSTRGLIEFGESQDKVVLNGEAKISVIPKGLSGIVNLTVESQNFGMATSSLKISKDITASDIEDMNPRVLYSSILGGSFANPAKSNNLASALLYSGKTQAVTSIVADDKESKRLIYLDGRGFVDTLDDNIELTAFTANDSFPYQRIDFTDSSSNEVLASSYLVPGANLEVKVLAPKIEVPLTEAVYIQKNSDVNTVEIRQNNSGGANIMEGEKIAASVDQFGRIFLGDELELGLADKEKLTKNGLFTFEILRGKTKIATVYYHQTSEIKAMPYSSNLENYFPGTYLQLASNSEKYGFVESFGGISTDDPKGLYLVDTNEELERNQKPGLVFESLESADKNKGIGFEFENKNMLLFAAGNSVGESNIPYASEVGIVLGDPTVRLKIQDDYDLVSSTSGYTKDIGLSIYTGEDEIDQLIKMDYNNDGLEDVLTVYKDGLVGLLENRISNKSFRDRGFVLKSFSEIMSAARIDVDNDGYDDLVIGTFDSCKENETCLTLYRNNNGNFEQETLDLAISGKALQMQAADVNIDGCEDLIVSDSAANTRVFYNQSSGGRCQGLERNYGSASSYNFGSLTNFDVREDIYEINFDIGSEFKKPDGSRIGADDNYPDIRIRPSVNPSKDLIYLYSTGELNADDQVIYEITTIPATVENDTSATNDLQNLQDQIEEDLQDGELSASLQAQLEAQTAALRTTLNPDKDGDGVDDNWQASSSNENLSDKISNEIENAVSLLRCSGGGCLPTPYNRAFLVPDGSIPGIATVAFGTPTPWGVSFFYPSTGSSSVRFYTSPTMSGGLGGALCVGAGEGACFAFAVPLQALGICKELFGPINNAIAGASNVATDAVSGATSLVEDGVGDLNLESYAGMTDAEIDSILKANINIKVPGFPSALTEWYDEQVNLILSALMDAPDFYLIYPDTDSIISGFEQGIDNVEGAVSEFDFQNMGDVINAINSLPIINIDTKKVHLKVPSISRSEIDKYRQEMQNWTGFQTQQIAKIDANWNCEASIARRELCDSVKSDINVMMENANLIMDRLDQISNIPREILRWRDMEAKYANQIVCYLDAIMQFQGGYLKRQEKIIASWMQSVEQAIQTFKDWQVVLDVMEDYENSCGDCSNQRFSDIAFLADVFISLPALPVFKVPHWPDIVFDISQIKMGVDIVWPEVEFEPVPITLPEFPTVIVPDVLPELDIEVNSDFGGDYQLPSLEFGLPDWMEEMPEFELPELPDLPDLPLPQLPDLPRPPKIIGIPDEIGKVAASLKPIFTIMCMINKGYLITPESQLATQIETLTQPSVQSALGILKAQTEVQPFDTEYSFVKRINIEAKLNLGIETDFIYETVRNGANELNDQVDGLVDGINDSTSQNGSDVLQQYINDRAVDTQNYIKRAGDEVNSDEVNLSASANPVLNSVQGNYQRLADIVNEYNEELESAVGKQDETIYLTATMRTLDKDDAILNRSLDEIKDNNLVADLPDSPGIRKIASLRNELIAYAEGVSDTNEVLREIDDLNEFTKILVKSDQALNVPLLASTEPPIGSSARSVKNDEPVKLSFLGSEVERHFMAVASEISGSKELMPKVGEGEKKLVAAAGDTGSTGVSQSAGQASETAKGFYVVAGGRSENVLDYTNELTGKVRTVFEDVDGDGDSDIIYSMGGSVYLKRNFKTSIHRERGDVFDDETSISDFTSSYPGAVEGLTVDGEGHKTIELSWQAAAEASYYEIQLLPSLNLENSDQVIRYFATTENDQALPFESKNIVEILDPENPHVTITPDNDTYYITITAVNAEGTKAPASFPVIAAPTLCADRDAPLPVVNGLTLNVPIFMTEELDASGSIDPSGEVVEYYVVTEDSQTLWSDLTQNVDENSDGSTTNDRSNPTFVIGPFDQPGVHEVTLHVVDQSGHESSQVVTINVYAPDLTLDDSFARTSVASGNTIPSVAEMPLTLLRERFIYRVIDQELALIPRIDDIAETVTNSTGKYEISDFNLENMIEVENASGEVVAEIHPDTGNVGILRNGYSTRVVAAKPGTASTSLEILDTNGKVMTTVYYVSDPNSDVAIHSDIIFDNSTTARLKGVHVSDRKPNDTLVFRKIPADDPNYPGSAVFMDTKTGTEIMVVDTAGNILINESFAAAIQLKQKLNNHKDQPFVIAVDYNGSLAADIFIETSRSVNIVGPKDVPAYLAGANTSQILEQYTAGANVFTDFDTLDDELQSAAFDLYRKGVIEGVETENGLEVNADELVSRAEFVKILLSMICIIPREEAYTPYSSGEADGGFSDIEWSENLDWFYPYVKEGALRGLVEGYKGETNTSGLSPFKPKNTITRAEASKIILETLEMQGVVNLSNIQTASPWYAPYVEAAQDLTPYMDERNILKNNYILTPEEAANPEKEMTRGELIIMAMRVLDIYNCFQEDGDNDGVSDFCEAKYSFDLPDGDMDNDGLSNGDECFYGTDPTVPNLDVPTTPINANAQDGESGLYAVPAECNTCPCGVTLVNKSDIMVGDTFFTVVSDKATNQIFSKSNEVRIQQLKE